MAGYWEQWLPRLRGADLGSEGEHLFREKWKNFHLMRDAASVTQKEEMCRIMNTKYEMLDAWKKSTKNGNLDEVTLFYSNMYTKLQGVLRKNRHEDLCEDRGQR